MNREMTAPENELTHTIRNFSVLLSPTPRGARLARLLAREQLRTWGVPLDPAEHIVAELANNATTHGRVPGRDFRLTLYVVADTLRIEVTDTRGDRLPCLVPPSAPDAESGRGLLLVEALADRWGVAPGPDPRKTAWAEVKVQTGEPARRIFRSAGASDSGRTDPSESTDSEISQIIDERMTNRASGVPIEDVRRETLDRGEARQRFLKVGQQWDENGFRRRHAAERGFPDEDRMEEGIDSDPPSPHRQEEGR